MALQATPGAPLRTFQESRDLEHHLLSHLNLMRVADPSLETRIWDVGRPEACPPSQRLPHHHTPPKAIDTNQPDAPEGRQSCHMYRTKPPQQRGGNAHKQGHREQRSRESPTKRIKHGP